MDQSQKDQKTPNLVIHVSKLKKDLESVDKAFQNLQTQYDKVVKELQSLKDRLTVLEM